MENSEGFKTEWSWNRRCADSVLIKRETVHHLLTDRTFLASIRGLKIEDADIKDDVKIASYPYIYVIHRLRGPVPKGEGRFQDRGHSFSHPDRGCR